MRPLVVRETIVAPPDRVFALATDLAGAPQRIAGIESIDLLSDGPFGVGTRWRETRLMMGKRATEEMEITEHDPGRSYSAIAESNGCRYTSVLRCEPTGEGKTDLSYTFSGKALTLTAKACLTLMAPVGWMMARMIRKCLAEDLADLRRAAEAEAG